MKKLIVPITAACIAFGATAAVSANPPAPETHCDDKGAHSTETHECDHHEGGKGH